MVFRLGLGAGLIAATVVIQALFMTVGLDQFKRIESEAGALPSIPRIMTVIWVLFLLIPIVLGYHDGVRSITGGRITDL